MALSPSYGKTLPAARPACTGRATFRQKDSFSTHTQIPQFLCSPQKIFIDNQAVTPIDPTSGYYLSLIRVY